MSEERRKPPRVRRCRAVAYAVEHTQAGHAVAVLRCAIRRHREEIEHVWGVETMRLADQQPTKGERKPLRSRPKAKR